MNDHDHQINLLLARENVFDAEEQLQDINTPETEQSVCELNHSFFNMIYNNFNHYNTMVCTFWPRINKKNEHRKLFTSVCRYMQKTTN